MKSTRTFIEFLLRINKRKELYFFDQFTKDIKSIEELENEQLIAFKSIFNYAKREVPYYKEMFNKLKLYDHDFTSLEDLYKIPIITKKDIVSNYDSFIPTNYKGKYVVGKTGGSTGEPLKYRMDYDDYSKGMALLFRGLNYGGYNVGDKMAIIAGGSMVKNRTPFRGKIRDVILNYKKFSSYGFDENDMERIYLTLKKWNPHFLRGYASSLTIFANYCILNNKKITFKSVFSTAEMLLESQRDVIEQAFGCKVYNNYGLNDGGVSAFEDGRNNGFKIDTERSIMEIVGADSQENIINHSGRIIATSLYNYAFPFIRYDTGDLGCQEIRDELQNKFLVKLEGRTTDYLEIEGKIIGSPVLTVLMGNIDTIRYQIIQTKKGSIEIRIERGEGYTLEQERFISESLKSNLSDDVHIDFVYTSSFIETNNKHKFIIKE